MFTSGAVKGGVKTVDGVENLQENKLLDKGANRGLEDWREGCRITKSGCLQKRKKGETVKRSGKRRLGGSSAQLETGRPMTWERGKKQDKYINEG